MTVISGLTRAIDPSAKWPSARSGKSRRASGAKLVLIGTLLVVLELFGRSVYVD